MKYLLTMGAFPHVRTDAGDGVYHLVCNAVAQGKAKSVAAACECVSAFLAAGVLQLSNNEGARPLHVAAASGCLEVGGAGLWL